MEWEWEWEMAEMEMAILNSRRQISSHSSNQHQPCSLPALSRSDLAVGRWLDLFGGGDRVSPQRAHPGPGFLSIRLRPLTLIINTIPCMEGKKEHVFGRQDDGTQSSGYNQQYQRRSFG